MSLARLLLFLLLPVILYSGVPALAQRPALAGQYRLNQNHEPEGGTKLMLFADSTWVIVYFGGARTGRWRVQSDTLLYLQPTDVPALPVMLFGRHHEGLKGRTRMYFGGFDNHQVYAALGRSESLRLLFNEDANCVPFPVVDTVQGDADSVRFLERIPAFDEAPQLRLYTFANPQRYNDFIAIRAGAAEGSDRIRPDRPFAAVRKSGLAIGHGDYVAERQPLTLSSEDTEFMNMLRRRNPDPDSLLFNPRYRQAGAGETPFSPAMYVPRPGGDALVYRQGYTEGAELEPSFEYHDMSILYLFRKLQPQVADNPGLKTGASRPRFNFTCD